MGASNKFKAEQKAKRDTTLKTRWAGRSIEIFRSSGMIPASLQGTYTDEAAADRAIAAFNMGAK